MPLPFFVIGAGAAGAAIFGAKKHHDAHETNESANYIVEKAEKKYERAKGKLEKAYNNSQEALLKLGNAKQYTLEHSMDTFLRGYDRVKHIMLSESTGLNELSAFSFEPQDAVQMKELSGIYSNAVSSGVAGVAAGAAVG